MRQVAQPTADEIKTWTNEERAEYEDALCSPESYRALVVGSVITKNRAAHAHERWPNDELAKMLRAELGDGRKMAGILRQMLTDPRATPEDRRELEAHLQYMRESGLVVDDA